MKIDIYAQTLPDGWADLREPYGYRGFIQLENVDRCDRERFETEASRAHSSSL